MQLSMVANAVPFCLCLHILLVSMVTHCEVTQHLSPPPSLAPASHHAGPINLQRAASETLPFSKTAVSFSNICYSVDMAPQHEQCVGGEEGVSKGLCEKCASMRMVPFHP